MSSEPSNQPIHAQRKPSETYPPWRPYLFPLNTLLCVSRKLPIAPHPSSCFTRPWILRIRWKKVTSSVTEKASVKGAADAMAELHAPVYVFIKSVCSQSCRVRFYRLPFMNFPWVSPLTCLGIMCVSHLVRDSPSSTAWSSNHAAELN